MSECIEWDGYRHKKGYGAFCRDGKVHKTHRRCYEICFGPIPKGMCVLHRCDNPPCINPDHLFLGSHAENMADMRAKGRANRPAGEKNGRAKLTDAQTAEIRASSETRAALARRFGVSWTRINAIKRDSR